MSKRSKNRRNHKTIGTRGAPEGLPVLRRNVAGIDVGSSEHWVCGPHKPDQRAQVETFGSTTSELEKLLDWLNCQWIELLHSCGLLRGSFRPSEEICQLRALMRECSNLIEERSRAVERMQKALDQMNVQVHRAVTEITGTTGMGIIRSIVAGERDPLALAGLRDKRWRKSEAEFAEHLRGTWREEHLFNLSMHLELYDKLNEMIETYQQKIGTLMGKLEPEERSAQQPPDHPNSTKAKAIVKRGEEFTRQALWRFSGVDLTRIDAISTGAATMLFTEVGLDLSAFPTEKHFISWLRLCPHRAISGGKVLKKKRNAAGATRTANVLRMAACSLQRSQSALGAQFRRIARRKGYSVAVFATARKLAILIYRMLRYGEDYVDQGAEAYEEQYKERLLPQNPVGFFVTRCIQKSCLCIYFSISDHFQSGNTRLRSVIP